MQPSFARRIVPAFAPATASLVAALLIAACGQPHGGPAGFGGPVPVSVIAVEPETLPFTLEYTAQTLGVREVEVRARVAGILKKRNYQEGGRVKAGQSLFTLDPEPFSIALARNEAELAGAEARHAQAARDLARLPPLLESKAISRKDYDDAVSAEAIAAATAMTAKAMVRQAKLDLEWSRVEAPISGFASRALKSEGSLVSGPDVLLTTVTQTDPMQVLFGISDNERLKLREQVEAKRLTLPEKGRFTVRVKLADGSYYDKTGVTDFADLRISRDTGTSEARAELPNPDGVLQPGQFVRVQLSGATRSGVFRIPQRAVLEGPQGKFVFIVGKENKAEMRPVEVGEWTAGNIVVTGGLQAGDQVIVDGVLKLGPGAPVQASPLAAGGEKAAEKPAEKAPEKPAEATADKPAAAKSGA